jgi:hypothetical protein
LRGAQAGHGRSIPPTPSSLSQDGHHSQQQGFMHPADVPSGFSGPEHQRLQRGSLSLPSSAEARRTSGSSRASPGRVAAPHPAVVDDLDPNRPINPGACRIAAPKKSGSRWRGLGSVSALGERERATLPSGAAACLRCLQRMRRSRYAGRRKRAASHPPLSATRANPSCRRSHLASRKRVAKNALIRNPVLPVMQRGNHDHAQLGEYLQRRIDATG